MSDPVVVSFWSPEGGQEMGRMEVITRTERRRTYNEAEKAAVVAEASAPGVTVIICGYRRLGKGTYMIKSRKRRKMVIKINTM